MKRTVPFDSRARINLDCSWEGSPNRSLVKISFIVCLFQLEPVVYGRLFRSCHWMRDLCDDCKDIYVTAKNASVHVSFPPIFLNKFRLFRTRWSSPSPPTSSNVTPNRPTSTLSVLSWENLRSVGTAVQTQPWWRPLSSKIAHYAVIFCVLDVDWGQWLKKRNILSIGHWVLTPRKSGTHFDKAVLPGETEKK